MKTDIDPGANPGGLRIGLRLGLLVLALAVPFVGYSIFAAFDEAELESKQAGVQMLATARVTAARLDDQVNDVRQLLKTLTVLVCLDQGCTERNDALLKRLVPQLPQDVANLTVWDLSGENIGAIDLRIRTRGPASVAARKFFADAMKRTGLAVEAPVAAVSDGKLIAILALPIVRDGVVVGAIAASVRLAGLQKLLDAETLPEGALVTVVSPDRLVLARTIDPERWVGKPIDPPGQSAARIRASRSEGTVSGPSADGVDRIGGFATARAAPWLVFVGRPKSLALAPVYAHLRSNLLNVGGMLLVGLLLAYLIAETIASPLRSLSAEAQQLADDDVLRPIQTRARGEVGVLAVALTRMTERLSERTAELKASEIQLRHITDNTPALISYLDTDQRFVFANGLYSDWLGVDNRSLIGKSLAELYGRDAHKRMEGHILTALDGSRVVYERPFTTLQGVRDVEVTLIPDVASDGSTQGLFALINDVSAARKSQAELAASKRQLQMIADNMPAMIAYLDKDERFGFVNVQAERTFGVPGRHLIGRTFREVRGEAMYGEIAPHMAAALRGQTVSFEFALAIGGKQHHYQSTYTPDFDHAGSVAGYYAMTVDITALKETQRQLDLLSRVDALTGLANRREFAERLEGAMARSRRSRQLMALVFLDIDRFKSVNDLHGHGVGDAVLTEFAERLKASTRATDTVARLAGDEFVVILEHLHARAEIELVAQKIVAATREPMRVAGAELVVTCSLGYAAYEGDGGDAAGLTEKADQALYRAKEAGRDTYAATNFAEFA